MKKVLLYITLFLIAFLPRIWNCEKHINCDGAKFWFGRCTRFIQAVKEGEFTSTFQAPHPGVTLMWIAGASLHISEKLGYKSNTSRIFAAKLPIVFITSIFCLLLFHILKNVFDKRVAILAFLFCAFEPHFLAHCREFQLDALLTSFMSLSLLFYIYFLQSKKCLYLCFCALCNALGVLTKLPALLLLPLFASLSLYNFWNKKKEFLRYTCIFLLIFSFTLFIWPIMWKDPFFALKGMIFPSAQLMELKKDLKFGDNTLIESIRIPHWNNFFLGRIVKDPGPFFYPLVFLFNMGEITSLLFFAAIIYFLFYKKDKRLFCIFFYIFFVALTLTFAQKKLTRYMLPTFPVINVLCACFIVYAFSAKKKFFLSLSSLCVFLHIFFSLLLHPYYLAHYNRLFFSPKSAQHVFFIGWGEGLEKAALYINQKENSKNLKVATWYEDVFRLFSNSRVYGLSFAEEADYIILYINQIQRNLFPNVLKKYEGKMPEHVIKINGIEYCKIYKKI